MKHPTVTQLSRNYHATVTWPGKHDMGRGNHDAPSQANLEIQGIEIARPPAARGACWGGRRSIMLLLDIGFGIKRTCLGSGGRLWREARACVWREARNKLAPRLPRRQAPRKVGMHVSHASRQSCPVPFRVCGACFQTGRQEDRARAAKPQAVREACGKKPTETPCLVAQRHAPVCAAWCEAARQGAAS